MLGGLGGGYPSFRDISCYALFVRLLSAVRHCPRLAVIRISLAACRDGYFAELATKLFPEIRFPRRTYINER